MAIGLSIFLITIGAIFRFGINVDLSSLNFHAIGMIIMLAGFALLSIQMFWIVRTTAAIERRKITDRDNSQQNMTSYRDTTRDDNRPPYYLGPPLDDRC
jgi:hypothetical protein